MLPRKMEVAASKGPCVQHHLQVRTVSARRRSGDSLQNHRVPQEIACGRFPEREAALRRPHTEAGKPSGTGKSVTEPSWWLGGFHHKPAVAGLQFLLMIAKTCSD